MLVIYYRSGFNSGGAEKLGVDGGGRDGRSGGGEEAVGMVDIVPVGPAVAPEEPRPPPPADKKKKKKKKKKQDIKDEVKEKKEET
ncbi:hypothetical protein L1987_62503 [Smallanthus sonchifolius]|uniref:Uncharacterized protein n=1 Tax=Smallanthus sonchifolius TaxID=185202 RepID=A0ACB9CAT6_9ASTR|nr:hypothetical protein L1987_62503 [Smallanthus sonchifolius]